MKSINNYFGLRPRARRYFCYWVLHELRCGDSVWEIFTKMKEIEYQRLKSVFYDFLETSSLSENKNSAEQYYGELTRLKKKLGNLRTFEEKINIIDNKLFSYKVNLPKKIHPGTYKIRMTLIDQKGIALSKSEQRVNVSKVGIQEFLSSNSKNNPVFYGIFSVIIALLLGFSAAQLFRWLYR